MLHLGQFNTLKVLRSTSVGLFLGDQINSEVLLPNKYVLPSFKIDDEISVFIYKDQEERFIATTLIPTITLHQFGFLRVSYVNEFGAYLNWGLEKDLFVPFKQQLKKMEVDEGYVVYLYLDEVTERLVASNKIAQFLINEDLQFVEGEEVDLLIYGQSDLGYKAIINQKYNGLIYYNEIFQVVRVGDYLKGYIKAIREDQKIDLRLQKAGYQNIGDYTLIIYNYLKAHQGFLPLTDNSTPLAISKLLTMSKKSFKKAIGNLLKENKISIEAAGIRLIE